MVEAVWIDGFTPAITSFTGSSEQRMVVEQERSSPKLLRLVEDIDAALVDELYACACDAGCPLGVYVPTAEVVVGEEPAAEAAAAAAAADKDKDAPLRPLARRAARAIFLDSGALDAADLARVHGFMCWCLPVGVGSSVTYHVDYGESLRYETNLIVPPLYGAVLHCSDLEHCAELDASPSDADDDDVDVDAFVAEDLGVAPFDAAPLPPHRQMGGGVYYVHRDGLPHYARWGFKGKLLAAEEGTTPSPEELLARVGTEEGWVRVPYRYRRAIVQDGDLPHLSTRVSSLPPGQKRVILGINAYGAIAGPMLQRMPDHSQPWLNKLKLYQALARCTPAQRAKLMQSMAQRRRPAPKPKPPAGPSPFAACKAEFGVAWATMSTDAKRTALERHRTAQSL